MKKIYWLIAILITIPTLSFAQEMSVKSFYLAETDLTANTPGTMVYDQNGNVCALIKVETTLDGFTFDVGSLGISEVKRNGGEMWVYVPFGIRKITINHPQLGIVRDYALPTQIEQGRTYILKLNASLGNRVYDSSKKQKMILQVFPTNAKVEINGISMDLDRNGICEQEFSFGIYEVIVSASKYHTIRRQIEINDEKNAQRFNIRLKQAFGWLQLSCDGNEKLYIDGQAKNFFPNKGIELESGHYKILLEKPLHLPFESTIEIKDSTICNVTPKFIANYKELEFKVYNEAEIWIDNKKVATGNYTDKLEYGPHKIECRKQSHRSTQTTLNIGPTTLGPIVLEAPEPIYGTLIVSTTPTDADIFIDEKFVGKTPTTLRTLIGPRNISLKKAGYNTESRIVKVQEEETARVDIKLDNIIPIKIISAPTAYLYIDGKIVGTTPWSGTVLAGDHNVKLTAPRFNDIEKAIDVDDTNKEFSFNLKRKYYYNNSFSFGALATSGLQDIAIGGYLGIYLRGFYIEGYFQKGLATSEPIYWNALQSDNLPVKYTYSPMTFGGKIGYGIIAGNRFRITPNIGSSVVKLNGTLIEGNNQSFDPSCCSAIIATGGMKLSLALSSCIELHITPEYYVPVSQTDLYKPLYETSPIIQNWSEGFKINIGLGLFF